MNNRLSEDFAVVGTISPQKINTGTVASSGQINMAKFKKVLFTISCGLMDTTIDAKIREAKTSGGGSEQDLAGKTITQYTASDDDKITIIEVDASELSDDYTHLSCDITVGTGATVGAYVAMVAYGSNARNRPASDDDLAAVKEIVA